MGKEKHIKITVEGKTPLLCNRFTDAAQMEASAASRSSIVNDAKTPKECAQDSLYFDEEGKIGIPGPNVFRCLIDAGKYFRLGKSKLTTLQSSLVPGAVDFDTLFCEIDSEDGWQIDTRPVRIPSTGGRVLKHRASFHDWKLSFEVELDTAIITLSMFRDLVDAAGKRVGLADFRPDKKGIFGKFRVVSWEVEK